MGANNSTPQPEPQQPTTNTRVRRVHLPPTTCLICGNNFANNVHKRLQLQCHHVFCHDCLLNMYKPEGGTDCAVCHQMDPCHPDALADVTKDYVVGDDVGLLVSDSRDQHFRVECLDSDTVDQLKAILVSKQNYTGPIGLECDGRILGEGTLEHYGVTNNSEIRVIENYAGGLRNLARIMLGNSKRGLLKLVQTIQGDFELGMNYTRRL